MQMKESLKKKKRICAENVGCYLMEKEGRVRYKKEKCVMKN